MTKFLTPPEPLIKEQSGLTKLSKQPFWLIAALANATIWVLALALLQLLKPAYTSKGAMIIPGVGTQGNVNVPGLNNTSANSSDGQSPYSYLLKVDPRQNYQYIAMSDAVLSQAAKAMDMTVEEFGEPTIILGEGTTIIEFSLEGQTASEAQQKANVFYESLVNHTNYLRVTQLNNQKETTQKTLQSSKNNVREAQSKLSQFRSNSALKVAGQIDSLSDRLEDLRLKKADLQTQERAVDSRLKKLEISLSLVGSEASEALLVIDDRILQKGLQDYSSTVQSIQLLSSSLTASNPQVIEEKIKAETVRKAIVARGYEVLGRSVNIQTIERLNLSAEKGRKELVELLVTVQAEQSGLANQIQELDRQIDYLDTRLTTLVEQQPTLNRLEQDVQLSESILVSDVAKLNLNKPELATSYPVLQLLSEPSLPEEADDNRGKTIILGALAASFLCTTGIVMFWWEKPDFTTID
jgi:uncharacterized protein involved in exopolysaccharide biosynthesis